MLAFLANLAYNNMALINGPEWRAGGSLDWSFMSVTVVRTNRSTGKVIRRVALAATAVGVAGFIGGVVSAEGVAQHMRHYGVKPDKDDASAESGQSEAESTADDSADQDRGAEAAKAAAEAFEQKVLDALEHDDEAAAESRPTLGQRFKDSAKQLGVYGAALILGMREATRDAYDEAVADISLGIFESLARDDASSTKPQPGDVIGADGSILSGMYHPDETTRPEPPADCPKYRPTGNDGASANQVDTNSSSS